MCIVCAAAGWGSVRGKLVPDLAQMYVEDMMEHPDNGYALKGLTIALQALDRPADAAQIQVCPWHAIKRVPLHPGARQLQAEFCKGRQRICDPWSSMLCHILAQVQVQPSQGTHSCVGWRVLNGVCSVQGCCSPVLSTPKESFGTRTP